MNIIKQSENTAFESYTSNSEKNIKHSQDGFNNLGIVPSLLKAINRLKFKSPTPIQMEAIPVGITGEDLIALAQTGSGKTLAFGIPMLQQLSKQKHGIGLVLVPTRELAIQVEESLQAISRPLKIRSVVLIGGASMIMQRNLLNKKPRIIIATPGRLMDHLERKTVNLSQVSTFVLDEADRMLDMGFVPDIKKIMLSLPEKRQTMLFSATMPKPIEKIAQKLMDDPVRIETDSSGTTPAEVSQEIFMIKNQDKGRVLAHHFKQCTGPILVFTRTKRMATKLTSKVHDMGFAAAEIHSDRSQGQRRNALEGFKRGRYQILVATDIAARGIDVSGIELVVNYDMPANSEDYVHRIGRTGRAGKQGHAISFATSAQKGAIRDLERFMKTKLTVSKTPDTLTEKEFFKAGAHLNLKEVFSKDSKSTRKRAPRKSATERTSSRTFQKDRPVRGSFSSEKASKRKEFFSTDGKKPSKYRYKSKQTHTQSDSSAKFEKKKTNRFSKETTSKSKDFVKRPAKSSFKKSSNIKRDSFKKKDVKKTGQKKTFAKSHELIEDNTFLKDTTNENSFWSKFTKKRPTKKKSVGQGSGRKRKSKK